MKNRTLKADYHVHTEFSDDSEYQMEQVVRDSIVMGLDEICFTDHVDYGVKNDWDDGEKIRYREGIPGEPEHLGTFIDETKQELKTLGFKEFCTFDKMKPIYHQL